MPNRYILALIKSETRNECPQDTNDFARLEHQALTERRSQSQSAQQPSAETGQLSFAFAR